MSAIGTKRTSLVALHMSAFGGKADMPLCPANVLLTQSGHGFRANECPLSSIEEIAHDLRQLPFLLDAPC
jgi:hypothetical protein